MNTRSPIDVLRAGLADLDARDLTRRRRIADTPCAPRIRIDGRNLVAFASNDYLGLANHPDLVEALADGARRYGVGSGGSHLLGGHSRAHALLEDTLAEYCGGFARQPRALTFSTGYMANLAMLTALAGPGATIYSDALNHASLIDGARLARADVRVYPHADTAALGAMLAADECGGEEMHRDERDGNGRGNSNGNGNGAKIIVTDAVFSMDGDIAPLADLLALAEQHQAWLVVDDAHGFGVQGQDGAGSVAALGLRSSLLIYMGTLGKAAGTAGAFVVAEDAVIEWLIQRARTYVFTTAAAPALAHATLRSIAIMRSDEGAARRARLNAHIETIRTQLGRSMGSSWAAATSTTFADHDKASAGIVPGAAAAVPASISAQGLRVTTLAAPGNAMRLPSSHTAIQPILVGENHAALALAERLLTHGFWVPAVRPPTVPAGTARLRLSLSAAHEAAEIEHLCEVLFA
ncbi:MULTISPECIES: 8-amino-7-oxononanoate synthase [unclassified Achromobacter]|uniref:aminotransferase class I/II-fold pyridoxal phosphate-dependent enzyme n=1 Tax=unclassified Achromobacter TaxID=2626865 RepID=UPI000B5167BA|nr:MULTISPECIES: 8-amino-7-oxononanoate synthase [unclassified Achromobacter]OWT70288.1 8-amino-7-oxononanoate synthase [Achromobacter sp. HZ34]OWT71828.1 8-amino-7-oxononanoate synthase [Achromobacter sp. HZ28]